MSDANFASLSSSLLARKGGAKPAMRPQSGMLGPVDGKEAAASLEDLGWNDMGDDAAAKPPVAAPARPVAKLVAVAPQAANESSHDTGAANQVRQSLDRIAAHLDRPVHAAPPPERLAAIKQGRRAAFTLRLDAERHLQLRLACTVRGRSAQQIVTDALDALLAEMPEIASLAAQVHRDGN